MGEVTDLKQLVARIRAREYPLLRSIRRREETPNIHDGLPLRKGAMICEDAGDSSHS